MASNSPCELARHRGHDILSAPTFLDRLRCCRSRKGDDSVCKNQTEQVERMVTNVTGALQLV